jgi:hypothetical protein
MRELFLLHTSYSSISAVPSSSSSVWNTLVILLLTSQIQALRKLLFHALLVSLSRDIYNASHSLHSHEWGLLTVMVDISSELFVVACLRRSHNSEPRSMVSLVFPDCCWFQALRMGISLGT